MAKTTGEEQSALHYASRYDSVEAIKVLIQEGSMIDGVDFLNRTALHVASESGDHLSFLFHTEPLQRILLYRIFK